MSILSANWQNFVGNLSIFGGLLAVAYLVLRLAVTHGFNAKLANLKGELDRKLENLKIDHQQLMFNFEAYNSRKHELYPELYKIVKIAFNDLMEYEPDFGRTTRGRVKYDEIKKYRGAIDKYCEFIEIPSMDTVKILTLWDKNPDKAIAEIRTFEDRMDYERIEIKWHNAMEYFIFNELYFSEEVATETRGLLKIGYGLLNGMNPIYNISNSDSNNANFKKALAARETKWRQLIKDEISPVNKGSR